MRVRQACKICYWAEKLKRDKEQLIRSEMYSHFICIFLSLQKQAVLGREEKTALPVAFARPAWQCAHCWPIWPMSHCVGRNGPWPLSVCFTSPRTQHHPHAKRYWQLQPPSQKSSLAGYPAPGADPTRRMRRTYPRPQLFEQPTLEVDTRALKVFHVVSSTGAPTPPRAR